MEANKEVMTNGSSKMSDILAIARIPCKELTDDASTKGPLDNPAVAGVQAPNNQVKSGGEGTSEDACDTIHLVTQCGLSTCFAGPLLCGSTSDPCGEMIAHGRVSETFAITLQTELCNNCAAIGIESVALFYAASKTQDMIRQRSKHVDSCGENFDKEKETTQRPRRRLDEINPGSSTDRAPGYESDDSLVVTKRRLSRKAQKDGWRRAKKSYHASFEVALPDMGIE